MGPLRPINVLGFSGCELPGCDCGARVVFGARRGDLRRLYEVLHREGFSFEAVPLVPGNERLAQAEPFTARAWADFEEYVAAKEGGVT